MGFETSRVVVMKDLNIIGGADYVEAQLLKHIGLLHNLTDEETGVVRNALPSAFTAVQRCWSEISNKYYNRDGVATFNINNSNQYCQFLLILAQLLSTQGEKSIADKIFGLNKMLNACDIYHETKLPNGFYIDHTIGVIIGRAKLGERLFLSQNCTIGSNPGKPDYPVLGCNNFLMSNVTIVGEVKTGDRVLFATGSLVIDMDVPSDSIVFGRTPQNVIKPLSRESFLRASPFVKDSVSGS